MTSFDEFLLRKAMNDYPAGTYFFSPNRGLTYLVIGDYYIEDDGNNLNVKVRGKLFLNGKLSEGSSYTPYLRYNKEWAEIVPSLEASNYEIF